MSRPDPAAALPTADLTVVGRPRLPTAALARRSPRGAPGVRQIVQAVLRGVFGDRPAFDAQRDPGDPGLLGPGSASWRVVAEPAAIAGGIRAVWLQTLHPLAMAGVAEHSAYREEPLARLHRTAAYVTRSTFGSTREALEIARGVRATHRRVRGVAPDGRPYAADDPRLLVWVSVALTSSFLVADRLWSPTPLDEAGADRFVAEQSRLAALLDPRFDLATVARDGGAAVRSGRLGAPLLDDLPVSARELDRVLVGFAPELAVTGQTREAIAWLRRPPLPRPARPGYRVLSAGAVGSLARGHRRLLRIAERDVTARAAVTQTGLALDVMRLAVGVSPALAAARARVARHPTDARAGHVDADAAS